ncbi:MAG: Phospholipase D1 [Claussenomyces sp. TS43310]|nr:MAG: Phospholipase D1 [Claussenomyces sp. TS43310]
MAERSDESRSPRTQSPRSASPINTPQLGSTPAVSSGLHSELKSDSINDILAPGSGIEARDYMNGGLPHEVPNVPWEDGILASRPSSRAYAGRKQVPTNASSVNQDGVTTMNGTSTPPGRRSVQFVRSDVPTEHHGHKRRNTLSTEDVEDSSRDRRGGSLMSKLKALTLSGTPPMNAQSQSNGTISPADGFASAPQTPSTDRVRRPFHITLEEEDDTADADAEETADEGASDATLKARRKRRIRRPQQDASQTAPPTPRYQNGAFSDAVMSSGSRFQGLLRRSTMPDNVAGDRAGMSEGEGRDNLQGKSAWRRGSSWMASSGRGESQNGIAFDPDDAASPRRPSNFRRLTGFGGGSDGEAQSPRRPFLGAERATTFGAARWKMLKHGLKMLGQKKEEHKIDFLKSTELMAELRAGAPAALILASMIQRDEHGNKRIPVLLEQLKLQVTDSRSADEVKEGERHVIFRIELEYGNGLNRMKWNIERSIRDFINLHLRYKLQASSDKYIQLRSDRDSRPKQPRFPKSAFPWLRGVRGLGDSEEDEADTVRVDDTAGEATHSEVDRPSKRRRRHPSLGTMRRRSSAVFTDHAGNGGASEANTVLALHPAKKAFIDRQRGKLEKYLQEMIRWLIFRADSNRLCRFLELSALGVRLSAEGDYHGKEGFLVIQSIKGLDFRKILTPHNVITRHSPKWFLVRQNYIVCIDSPENMHIYDVYLLDSKFEVETKRKKIKEVKRATDIAITAKEKARPQHHRLKLSNSERRLKLLAKNERILRQFEQSIRHMMDNSPWSKPNRFGSFAPVRTGVFAQWLVDGRDYMWNVSRAINEAKDVIYIHDWWLSPQLYMRRPAAISQKWRLDRLLRKKAREGVKVYIIIYRNVEAAIPIDSEYTKFSMLDLHPNIFVQRSPNQFKKNQFFFAHHEKICVVDHSVAFVGGIDLCFGRWDTPQHSCCDDKPTGFEQSDEPKDADHCQLWPGKDYSNPRVQDFYQLSEPYAEMYDRSKTPRMPWHDVSMQVIGQPARDLSRHFIQRWNYVLRGRKPTRPTPFLLPPPDYKPAELESVGMNGTCEVQILRSASNWSLGLEETEHSIMNAYCKMIEESEHFVYMENQFFISSCETMNVKIVNKIGDAIVERAIRAHKNNESWRCVIIIPLMPGFQNTVDAADGTSVRLIMQCQFRSISRGEKSIFGRLRAEGIEPEEFVSFYSLRAWGKIGPNKMLVTEQLYIHAKVIIVDDRIALIGSANINERSMLGIRDSECAAVVRDTDMLWSTMDGEPYLVGRFAHTLRMRLMREHLGLDVDEIMEEERGNELDREVGEFESNMNQIYDQDARNERAAQEEHQKESQAQYLASHEDLRSFNHDVDWEQEANPNLLSDRRGVTTDKRVIGNTSHAADVDGEGKDRMKDAEASGIVQGRDSVLVKGSYEVLAKDIAPEGRGSITSPKSPHVRLSPPSHTGDDEEHLGPGNDALPPRPRLPRLTTEQLGLPLLSQLPALPILDDTDIGGPPVQKDKTGKHVERFGPVFADLKAATVEKDCMRDPLNDTFFDDVWHHVAENNTKIFRRVFRCNPDNEVTNWHEYTEFQAYGERFTQAQNGAKSQGREEQENKGVSGPPGSGLAKNLAGHGRSENANHPLGTVAEWAEDAVIENKARTDTLDANESASPLATEPLDEKTEIRQEYSAEPASPIQPSGEIPFPSIDGAAQSAATVDSEKGAGQGLDRQSTFATASSLETQRNGSPQKRRRRATTRSRRGFSASDDLISRADAEALLDMVQGNLVVFPYDWLKVEEHNSNWLYQVDMVAPLQIYN